MININISDTVEEMGRSAAKLAAEIIEKAVQEQGKARIIISTGESQFSFFENLRKFSISWDKVEVFHLDEYVGLPVTHKASFRKYIKERLEDKLHPGEIHYVDGENPEKAIRELTEAIRKEPIDLGIIGIGENGHIAFNDPPAVLEEEASYKIVNLEASCKRQQVGEGWFSNLEEVPDQAVTATVPQIMQCREIISVVPNACKAEAVRNTLMAKKPTREIPASVLKTHSRWNLFIDKNAAALL